MLFSTADDVHASLGRLLQELTLDAELAPRLMVLDTVLQFRFRHPDAVATLILRGEDAPAVVLGDLPEGAAAPEIVVTIDADVAHALWRGRHNVTIGLARGTIQAKGETTRIVELLRLTDEIAPRYDQLLRAAGRADLADAEAPAQEAPGPAADAAQSGGAAEDAGAAEGEPQETPATGETDARERSSESDDGASSEGSEVAEAAEAAPDPAASDSGH